LNIALQVRDFAIFATQPERKEGIGKALRIIANQTDQMGINANLFRKKRAINYPRKSKSPNCLKGLDTLAQSNA